MSSFRENEKSGQPQKNEKEDMLLYTIGAVSEMCGIHQQTLRLYDREGLVRPARTSGNTRMYSKKDVEKLEMILRLTRELGVNRAGAGIIIHMREKLEDIQNVCNQVVQYIRDQLSTDYPDIDARLKNILNKAPCKDKINIRIKFPQSGESSTKESS